MSKPTTTTKILFKLLTNCTCASFYKSAYEPIIIAFIVCVTSRCVPTMCSKGNDVSNTHQFIYGSGLGSVYFAWKQM